MLLFRDEILIVIFLWANIFDTNNYMFRLYCNIRMNLTRHIHTIDTHRVVTFSKLPNSEYWISSQTLWNPEHCYTYYLDCSGCFRRISGLYNNLGRVAGNNIHEVYYAQLFEEEMIHRNNLIEIIAPLTYRKISIRRTSFSGVEFRAIAYSLDNIFSNCIVPKTI